MIIIYNLTKKVIKLSKMVAKISSFYLLHLFAYLLFWENFLFNINSSKNKKTNFLNKKVNYRFILLILI